MPGIPSFRMIGAQLLHSHPAADVSLAETAKYLYSEFFRISFLILFAIIFVQAVAHAPKSPTQQWHDAIEAGMTWNEYVNQNK